MTEDTSLSASATATLLEQDRQIALQALALTVQPWNELAFGNDPASAATTDMTVCIQRIAALLHVRLVAVYQWQQQPQQKRPNKSTQSSHNVLSTSWICRQILMPDQEPWWPCQEIQASVTQQLTQFVTFILENYNNALPFHNFEHAYHVVISANKLVDLMLAMDSNDFLDDDRPPPSYGLRQDPIAMLAVMVAALVHDVHHTGVSNRQLSQEEHPLALQYNDHSINEHKSLHVTFQELLRDDYALLRQYMFVKPADYRRFRSIVIETVLATDIASPERSQISKSKWKEGFQQTTLSTHQQVPRSATDNRRLSMASRHRMSPRSSTGAANRRGSIDSMVSDVTMEDNSYYNAARYTARRSSLSHQQHRKQRQTRKLSMNSASDSVADSIADSLVHSPRARRRPLEQPTAANVTGMLNDLDVSDTWASDNTRESQQAGINKNLRPKATSSCNQPIEASKADLYVKEMPGPTHDKDTNDETIPTPRQRQQRPRRHSTQSYSTLSSVESFAGDSVRLAQQRHRQGAAPGVLSRRRAALEAARNNLRSAFPSSAEERADIGDVDDSSLSLTPPSSEDEGDYLPVHNVVAIANHAVASHGGSDDPQEPMTTTNRSTLPRVSRRASTGNIPMRFGPLTAGHRIDEEKVNNGGSMHRLLTSKSLDEISMESGSLSRAHHLRPKRLGIRRSIDFSGESIEIYSNLSRGSDVAFDPNTTSSTTDWSIFDEPDELRGMIVLELILRAADVGHLMQNWESMSKFSSRLFQELDEAHKAGRGPNLGQGWFDNQARALEHYVLPLALQLDETGVFGEFNGALFAQCTEINKDQWLIKGCDLTATLCKTSDRYFM